MFTVYHAQKPKMLAVKNTGAIRVGMAIGVLITSLLVVIS